ncbi:MAG: NAD-dependent deacylase, partial [Vulcanimicrobiaceae bacterium]
GLPTFRGAGGLWGNHRVEELASPEGFARDPVLVWTWYNQRRLAHAATAPNAGHRALAELEARVAKFTLATQNVDSLHRRAGSRNVLELHGHLRAARCTGCPARRSLADGMPFDSIEHDCGGRFRPEIVWFGESLPQQAWQLAVAAAERADLVLIVGTSGMVQPAATLGTHLGRPAARIEVNPEPSLITPHVDCFLQGSAAQLLPELVAP